MNKKDYTGWQEVFRFSFLQSAKSKAYQVSLIIFTLGIFLALPIMHYIKIQQGENLGATRVEALYIFDETGLGLDYAGFAQGERYEKLSVILTPSKEYEGMVEELEQGESARVLLRLRFEEMGVYSLSFVKPAKAGFREADFKALTEDFGTYFEDAKREAIQVTPEQFAFIHQPVETSVEFALVQEDGSLSIRSEEKSEGISMQEYGILLGGIIVVMLIINMSGGQIANSIVTEKSTRVVEYLMIHVRPMALIVGKILAALLLVVLQFACVGAAYGLGSAVSGFLFGPRGTAGEQSSLDMFLALLEEISPERVIIALAVILVGVLLYSILAGLAGASVSKVEELAEGMKLYQLVIVVGSYIGIGVCVMEMVGGTSPVILQLLCLIPISTPFVLPMNLLLGKVGIGVGLVSLVLILLTTGVLFSFTARVYESMIFYNGNVLKLKDILQLAKNRKAEKGESKSR